MSNISITCTNELNRLALFLLFNPGGIVDDSVLYYLEELSKVTSEIKIIVNGELLLEEINKINKFGEIIISNIKDLDITAYKIGIKSIGYKNLSKYDEIIFCDDSMFGPIYPFRETFDCMKDKELDFWGISRCYETGNGFQTELDTKPSSHIQTYFLVLRQPLFTSNHFKSYFKKLSKCKRLINPKDSSCMSDLGFTDYFDSLGYKWDTVIDTTKYSEFTKIPNRLYTYKLVRHDRMPLIRKAMFTEKPLPELSEYIRFNTKHLYNFLKDDTDYPLKSFWQVISKSGNGFNL
jgi:rhamnosyltransferase